MICNLPSISILHSTVEISDLDISPFDFYSLLFLREMNILSKIHLQSTVTHCFLLIVKLKSGGFMHSGSLFHFLHHCTIGDFRRFISNSHTSNDQFDDTWRNDSRRQENPIHFGTNLADIWIQINPQIWIWFLDLFWPWHRLLSPTAVVIRNVAVFFNTLFVNAWYLSVLLLLLDNRQTP